MRSFLCIVLLGLLSGTVAAADTLRVGSNVLSVGDSAVRVIELLGEPQYREPVQNTFGAERGERWQYRRGDNDITVTIRHARVVAIEDELRR